MGLQVVDQTEENQAFFRSPCAANNAYRSRDVFSFQSCLIPRAACNCRLDDGCWLCSD